MPCALTTALFVAIILGFSFGSENSQGNKGKALSAISADHWPVPAYAHKKDIALERKIAGLPARMDLDRKIGQMVQVGIGSCMYAEVRKYHRGSMVNHYFSGKLSFSWPRSACQASINKGDVALRSALSIWIRTHLCGFWQRTRRSF